MSFAKRIFGEIYENWGPVSQLIVGLLAFILAIRPGRVAELEKGRTWRIGLPLLVSFLFITGFIQSIRSDSELRGQVRTMYARTMLEATKDDIETLTGHIDSGFKSVVEAIIGVKTVKQIKPPIVKPPEQQNPVLPSPPHITWAQSRTLSPDPQLYALQVTIQSDQSIPVSFAIECTGPVSKVDAFLVGQGAYMSVLLGTLQGNPNVAVVKIGFPPLTPQTPLVVTILSKENIRVTGIRPYQQ